MNRDIYQRFLERLPKHDPLKICHLCVQERQNLTQSSEAPGRQLFENIMKLKFASAWRYPELVCSDCMRRLKETKEFLDILLEADAFWKTYLADNSHRNKPPVTIDQKEFVRSVDTIEHHGVDVKIKRESSSQPEAVFLPCSEVIETDFEPCLEEFKEEISCDSTGSIEVADFEANIETRIEWKPSGQKLMHKYNKKIKLGVKCEYCDKELLSTSAINTHIELHQRSLNCAHCGMTFRTMPTMRLHLLTMHRHGPSVFIDPFCALCQMDFPSKEFLRRHIREFHGTEKQIKCPDCDKTYCNTKKLIWHFRTHSEKRFQCSECPKICTTKITLKRHAAMHSDERPFMCELCGIRTKSKVSIRRHIIGVHEMKKQKNYKVRRPLKCPLCDEKYVKLSKMKLHLNEVHAELARSAWKRYRSLCCVICYLKFESTQALEEHCRKFSGTHNRPLLSRRKHNRQYEIDSLHYRTKVDRPFECNICKNTFKSQNALNSHCNTHSDKPRPFRCETCGATYTRSNDLRLHTRRAHTGERSVACTQCFYRCYTQHELNSHHARVHTLTKLME